MTIKETIDWCEQFIDNIVLANVEGKKRTLGLQAMQVCKSALEKQIPKKPLPSNEKEKDPFGRAGGTCPACGFPRLYDNNIYCGKCGQSLDWGDGK